MDNQMTDEQIAAARELELAANAERAAREEQEAAEREEAEQAAAQQAAEAERVAADAAVGAYRDDAGNVHRLDNGAFRHLLPEGLTKITDEEAAALEAAKVQAAADELAQRVPEAVTMLQARLALLQAGVYDTVQTVIDALPNPQKQAAAIEWEFAATVRRDSPLVAALAPALGLDDATVDALFRAAAKL